MAVVNIQIGNRTYTLSCEDGEEKHILALASKVHKRVEEISASVGTNINEGVVLAMASLMMQDEINEFASATKNPQATSSNSSEAANSDEAVSEAIEAIADYVETIAERIEKG